MKFKVDRETFLKPLQFVSGVVERKQTLAVLANALIVLRDGELSLTCSDSEVEIVARVAITDCDDEGEITVPAKKLTDICKSLPVGAMLEMSIQDAKFIIKSGRSRFSLTTLPASEFPNVEERVGLLDFNLPRVLLRSLLEQTSFAMANQDVRYYLNGLLLEVGDGLIRAVATDGHRLALSESKLGLALEDTRQVVIPKKAVLELARVFSFSEGDDELTISLSSNHIRIANKDLTFISKLIDGRFPDYKRVIPSQDGTVFIVDKEELRSALQRTAILSNEKYRGVRLKLSQNCIYLYANNPEQEAAEEQVFAEYGGEEKEIGFNLGYLLDVLGVIHGEQARFAISAGSNTLLIRGVESENSIYVVMPMKL